MGRLFLIDLEGNFYSCRNCHTHVALVDHRISKKYQCAYGRAFLFRKVVNVSDSKLEEPILRSDYTIVNIVCLKCESFVGWKYEMPAVLENKLFILPRCLLTRFRDSNPDCLPLQDLVHGEDPNMAAVEDV